MILKHLDINNEMVWSESLKAVKGIVGGIDYKVTLHTRPSAVVGLSAGFPLGLSGSHEITV